MTHKKVENLDAGTIDKFGGNDLDKWSDFASGVDVDDYDINSNTQYRYDRLQIRNSANTFGHKHRSLATVARTITYPDADITVGEGGAGGGGGGLSAGGQISFNGTAAQTVFNIPHGLGITPDFISVQAASTDAFGSFTSTKTSSNIVITYQIPPPVGTSNVTFQWGAGEVGVATGGLTASSITTLTGKTIGDYLDFDRVSAPANPATNKGRFYVKQIDTNNDGVFAKIKKAGAYMEVQIA